MKKKTAPKKVTAKKTTAKKAATGQTAGPKKSLPRPNRPTLKNLDIYGAKPLPWSRAQERLEAGDATAWWLATARPDGRPHLTAVGAIWADGKMYFTTGSGTRKGRNLADNPNCVLSASLKGLDLVIEGTARKVTDRATLDRIAKLYAAQGWPATVTDQALTAPYSAPSAGPPPWDLYVLIAKTAFGVATAEPHGATRWRFSAARRLRDLSTRRLMA